jgi:hypothetical protein
VHMERTPILSKARGVTVIAGTDESVFGTMQDNPLLIRIGFGGLGSDDFSGPAESPLGLDEVDLETRLTPGENE